MIANKKKVSVSIVIYKNYRDVEQAVKSILKFTSSSIALKIYAIDNSNEESQNRLEFLEYAQQNSEIEYKDMHANVGFGKAHNSILNQLDSGVHFIVNPDILLKEDSIGKIVEFMNLHSDYGMVIPRLVNDEGELESVYRRTPTVFDMIIRFFKLNFFKKRMAYHTMVDQDFSKPFNVPFGQGSFLAIRTTLFKKVGGFDERYFMYMEDADLCRTVNLESKLMYFPGTEVFHRWEKGSHKNLKLFKIHLSSMIKYFGKWTS